MHTLSRREALKRTLRTGAYVAPAILTAAIPATVAAASPAPPTGTIVGTVSPVSVGAGTITFAFLFRLLGGPSNGVLPIYVAAFARGTAVPTSGFVLLNYAVLDADGNSPEMFPGPLTLQASTAPNVDVYAIAVLSGRAGVPSNAIATGTLISIPVLPPMPCDGCAGKPSPLNHRRAASHRCQAQPRAVSPIAPSSSSAM